MPLAGIEPRGIHACDRRRAASGARRRDAAAHHGGRGEADGEDKLFHAFDTREAVNWSTLQRKNWLTACQSAYFTA
jgi:hypothetical protein